MQIMVNGISQIIQDTTTISDYLRDQAIDTILVVIEWNFTTPSREEWDRIVLSEGDNLEIIKIVGGG